MGLALWAMALLRRLPSRALLALALGLLLFTQTFYALAGIPQDDLFLRALLLAPKVTDAWSVEFPLLAWMPVVLLGFVIGRQIKRPDFSLHRLSASVGMILISAAGLVILLNGFGNLYTERRIILGKHPPDFAYLALYTGIALLLIAFHTRFPTLTAHWLLRWVAALGQAALVFYVLHVKVLEALAWALAPLELPPAGLSLLLVTMTLALLLPVCVVYRHAKRLYPHSPLQYL
jgi:surface polysaccharide O-acyltransferase-like enzyme